MDIKKILIYSGIFAGLFLVILTGMYFLYPVIEPDKAGAAEAEIADAAPKEFSPEAYSIEAVEELSGKVKNLRQQVDSLKQKEEEYESVIDSLKQVAEASELQQSSKTKQVQVDEEKNRQAHKDAAKALLNLDEDDLIPIVNLLSEKQLVELYSFATGMQREKLLRSLEPQKAAKILNKVMS